MLDYQVHEEQCRASLIGEVTIYETARLKQELVDMMNHDLPVELDLSAVTVLDTAGLQLLMFVCKRGRRHDQPVTLVNHSDAVVQAIQLFDLVRHFGDPIILTGSD